MLQEVVFWLISVIVCSLPRFNKVLLLTSWFPVT